LFILFYHNGKVLYHKNKNEKSYNEYNLMLICRIRRDHTQLVK